MQIVDLIWLPSVIDKLAWKHKVLPQEVEEVLFDREALILSARDMEANERRQFEQR